MPQGTFLDRGDSTDIRVATWNIYFDSVFPDVSPTRVEKFNRVAAALAPDVWAFQEMYRHTAAQVKSLLDAAQPLDAPGGWHVYKTGELAIASKFPIPAEYVSSGFNAALVDLPDGEYSRDLYLINNHYKCCGGYDGSRQHSSDFNVNWMHDARTPDGRVTLPPNTPIVVLGDLNIVEGLQPLTTLLNGDIVNNLTYGPDSPPDWDGSDNVAVEAFHNAIGPESYTWRDDRQQFDPGQLDYIIYTDSVMQLAGSFVLNTVAMSEEELSSAGLQRYDAVIDELTYDHLPVVADYRIPPPALAGDANGDSVVNADDLMIWHEGFGAAGNAAVGQGDFNGDTNVDGDDWLVWQREASVETAEFPTRPAPEPAAAALAACVFLLPLRRPSRRRR